MLIGDWCGFKNNSRLGSSHILTLEIKLSVMSLDDSFNNGQSQPGANQRRVMANMTSDIVDGGNDNRTPSGSSAQACGFGQRSRNNRAARSAVRLPRPVAR